MSRRERWPNTDNWIFVVRILKSIYGRAWRRNGEILFGLAPGGLRAHIDRDMPEAEMRAVEYRLREISRAGVAQAERQIDIERQADAELAEEVRRRQENRYRVAMDKDPDEMALFLRIMDLTAFPSEEEREAAKDAFRKKAA